MADLKAVTEGGLGGDLQQQAAVLLYAGHTAFGFQKGMGLYRSAEAAFNHHAAVGKPIQTSTFTDAGLCQQVAGLVCMDQRRILCQGCIQIKNTGQRVKLHLYGSNGTLQRFFGFCQHQGQRVTDVTHLLITQHRHILVDNALAVAACNIGSGQYLDHTGQYCCSRGVNTDNPS